MDINQFTLKPWENQTFFYKSLVFPKLCHSKHETCRRQILTSEVDPRTVRVKTFLMAVDPYHMYSNESERAI